MGKMGRCAICPPQIRSFASNSIPKKTYGLLLVFPCDGLASGRVLMTPHPTGVEENAEHYLNIDVNLQCFLLASGISDVSSVTTATRFLGGAHSDDRHRLSRTVCAETQESEHAYHPERGHARVVLRELTQAGSIICVLFN